MIYEETGGYGSDESVSGADVYGPVEVVQPELAKNGKQLWGQVRLPHQCDEWVIGVGPRQEVLGRIDELITDLLAARDDVAGWNA